MHLQTHPHPTPRIPTDSSYPTPYSQPFLPSGDTWLNPEDNTTIIGYVPRLYNITRPSIPAWVFTAPAAGQE